MADSILHNYIAEQQATAVRLEGLLNGFVTLVADHQQETILAQYTIASLAYDLARELNINLDSVNLPEDGRAAA